jgi:hypothetical protein
MCRELISIQTDWALPDSIVEINSAMKSQKNKTIYHFFTEKEALLTPPMGNNLNSLIGRNNKFEEYEHRSNTERNGDSQSEDATYAKGFNTVLHFGHATGSY